MFNTVEAFTRQFTPVKGGYLVYPSRRAGGKLVTDAEYEQLVTDWERVAGRAGRWKTVGVAFAAIAAWTLITNWLSPPEWADALLTVVMVVAVSASLFWHSTAPRRLVKDRPASTPPRPLAEAQREAMAALNWPFVVLALLISGAIFFGTVTATDRSGGTWAWLIGSGTMLGLYLGVALKKLLDWRG
jgi:hypothetical protein